MMIQPANPSFGNGQIVAVTTTSAAFTLTAKSKQIIATNLGSNPAYIRMTPTSAAATTADMLIPQGAQVTFTKDYDTVAGTIISTGGTTSVHIMPAEGF